MAANSTISIGFKIEDKGNGVKELILNGKNLREVMRANVEVAQKLQSSFINLAAVTTFFKNAADSAQGLCDKMRELGSVQRENVATAQLTGLMGEELRELRDSAKSVAEYFGKDYMEVLQSVNSVSKGFGVSAEEAMRMIKDGNSRFIWRARRGRWFGIHQEFSEHRAQHGARQGGERRVSGTTRAIKENNKCKKKLIVISTTNLALTLKSNTMKNSLQKYKLFLKVCYKT